ncbi:MAG: LLM class flavin-dependent oxidoreductase [Planctomycetota bacterium]
MKFDIFFSICQTEVDGVIPSERVMFENFFDQLALADTLGFGTAWLAESHLSCQVQKGNPGAVIPHFKGEIGLNTDILQLGHLVMERTKRMNVGSAIRNILCNGGPLAHAEAVRTFLSLHGLRRGESRRLELGFASGRFPFSNVPYGIVPRDPVEVAAWPALRGKVFQEAIEIFLRAIRGDRFSSEDIPGRTLSRRDFRSDADWDRVLAAHGSKVEALSIKPRWVFPKVGVIPFEAPLDNLRLTLGAHDAPTQILANTLYPCGVFNLSITPHEKIEETHALMQKHFHKDGGPWHRALMPRTVLVFADNTPGISNDERTHRAKGKARKALENYWQAVEGTLDPMKVTQAVDNALAGHPGEIRAELKRRFHPEDRLMLWFDFNNHNSTEVKASMKAFMEDVAPGFAG